MVRLVDQTCSLESSKRGTKEQKKGERLLFYESTFYHIAVASIVLKCQSLKINTKPGSILAYSPPKTCLVMVIPKRNFWFSTSLVYSQFWFTAQLFPPCPITLHHLAVAENVGNPSQFGKKRQVSCRANLMHYGNPTRSKFWSGKKSCLDKTKQRSVPEK